MIQMIPDEWNSELGRNPGISQGLRGFDGELIYFFGSTKSTNSIPPGRRFDRLEAADSLSNTKFPHQYEQNWKESSQKSKKIPSAQSQH
eukprot:1394704-Amorphochlora_amoeboformis.AAC.2